MATKDDDTPVQFFSTATDGGGFIVGTSPKGSSVESRCFPTHHHPQNCILILFQSYCNIAVLHLLQGRIILLGMLAPHLTGNVLVRGDRSSLLVGTDGKDGRADAEDTDVGDGRVALPGGGGIPPAAVGRPDLISWRIAGKRVVGLGMNAYVKKKSKYPMFRNATGTARAAGKPPPSCI